MKLLFDENLSRKLVSKLAALFPGSTHVALEGLATASDLKVWEFAKTQGFIVVTADANFCELVTTYGPPRKVIWLRSWTIPRRSQSNCSGAAHFVFPNSHKIPSKACSF